MATKRLKRRSTRKTRMTQKVRKVKGTKRMIKKMTRRSRRMIRRRRWGGAVFSAAEEEPTPDGTGKATPEAEPLSVPLLDGDNVDELYEKYKTGFIGNFTSFVRSNTTRTDEQNLKLLFLMKKHLTEENPLVQREFEDTKKKLDTIESKKGLINTVVTQASNIIKEKGDLQKEKNDEILNMINGLITTINGDAINADPSESPAEE